MSTTTGTLRDVIDQKALTAKTKRLDLSFNELLDMYNHGELEIQPAFQRIFAWDIIKQSQFIESLLLELPVPPIYVVEVEEGQYVLVDGLQRLSTYLHFRGVLNNESKGIVPGQDFEFDGCDIAPELNGKKWKDLDTALQIRLKRAFVSVQVIRRESDPRLKFHMFKRLNDGGTPISRQQVRNCVIRMLKNGPKLMEFVGKLARSTDYRLCCVEALSDEQLNEQFDQELVLRFFSLKNRRLEFKHDVAPFIDTFSELIASAEDPSEIFDFDAENLVFLKTFQILAASTGDLSFTFPNKGGTELTKGFSAYHFEGVTLGLQSNLRHLNPADKGQMLQLKEALRAVRLSKPFKDVSSGGGRNSPGPLRRRIELVEAAVSAVVS